MPTPPIPLAALILALTGFMPQSTAAPAQEEIPPARTKALIRVRPAIDETNELAVVRDQQTQIALLTSESTIRDALQNPEVKALLTDETDPVGYIQKRLRTAFEGEILGVWMSAGTPADQATIINALVGRYVDAANRRHARLVESRESSYTDSIKAEERRIETARQELESARSVAIDLQQESRPLILQRYHECERQDLALRLQAAEAEIRKEANALDAGAALQAKIVAAQREILGQERDTLRQILETDPPPAVDRDLLKQRIVDSQNTLNQMQREREKLRVQSSNLPPIELIQQAEGQ